MLKGNYRQKSKKNLSEFTNHYVDSSGTRMSFLRSSLAFPGNKSSSRAALADSMERSTSAVFPGGSMLLAIKSPVNSWNESPVIFHACFKPILLVLYNSKASSMLASCNAFNPYSFTTTGTDFPRILASSSAKRYSSSETRKLICFISC